jgi:nucleoside-diphosphate-sugar epimerase
LEAGRNYNLHKLFIPSSIAVFGDSAPEYSTPQKTYLDPVTIYGVSKAAAENLFNYYFRRYSLDVRSLRYPGVIGYQSLPGGGTTDFAVDMYRKAVSGQPYTCYLNADTELPMIYIDDALRAALELMEAPAEKIKVRSSYNLAAVSFTPGQLCKSIQRYFPEFVCNYQPDFRQAIADSWPKSIDDSFAREDWKWKPEFDLDTITADMVKHLPQLYDAKTLPKEEFK